MELEDGSEPAPSLEARLGEAEARLGKDGRQLFENEAKYRTLLEQLPAAIYVDEPNADGTTIYVSPQIEELVHPDDRDRLIAEYEEFLRTGQPENGDYRFLRPDGSTAWVHDRSKLVRDADGYPMFVQGVMFDITAQKEAELRISHLAYHDALTDLPNRVMFDEHLHLELGGEGELARAAVDLVVGRIMEALGEPAILAGSEVSTAGSVGSAIYPFDGEDRRALLMCADASMYALKRDARLAG